MLLLSIAASCGFRIDVKGSDFLSIIFKERGLP
jgi:hypothetical protein